MEFTIVKNAADPHWMGYFRTDPKVFGVSRSNSAYYSYAGKTCGIEITYESKYKAESDCVKMNMINESGGYAVCPVIQGDS